MKLTDIFIREKWIEFRANKFKIFFFHLKIFIIPPAFKIDHVFINRGLLLRSSLHTYLCRHIIVLEMCDKKDLRFTDCCYH
jgi:hypothetical protein